MFGCVDPGWTADEVVCDSMYDGFAKSYALPERSSLAFLFSWKGGLIVNRGDLDALERAVKRQLAATLPRIAVDLRGRANLSVIRAAIAASNRFEPATDSAVAAQIDALGEGGFLKIYLALPACAPGRGLDADAVLGIEVGPNGARLALRSEEGCLLASADDPWTSPASAIESLLARIHAEVEMQPLEGAHRPAPGEMIADASTAEGTLQASRRHLASLRDPVALRLAGAIAKQLGRADIDAAPFVRAVMREAFELDVGALMKDQLSSGPEIAFDLRDPRALRPGDLLFYVSYGYVPKVVLLYLGDGLIAQAADVRGVVVGPLPTELPWFFQVVARRPLAAGP
jgi:cell wall-associated NlpC family hydrolase